MVPAVTHAVAGLEFAADHPLPRWRDQITAIGALLPVARRG